MKLNPQQRKAVTQTDRPMLVLAGAGSGKTGVITQKIVWLIEHAGMRPDAIFAVTFTNKASAEMKQRLGKLLNRTQAGGVSVSTFHRLGLKILHKEFAAINLRRGFTILDQGDCTTALKNIIREHQLGIDEKPLLAQISTWKNNFVTPEAALSTADNPMIQQSAIAFGHYVNLLQACNSVDFDDLICLPVTLLQQNADIRDSWQGRIRHLLVDEYQDTNGAQYELVKLLTGKFGVLTAVGDDDQSIYSWRGANPENMGLLSRDYPTLEVVKLEQNYRSSQRILRSANKVIAQNPHLHPKKLWSDLAIGEQIRISVCEDAPDEADWVSSDIFSLKFRKNIKYGDIAILYRSNFQSRLFEQALREKQIPYHISGGSSFFDRAEIKDVLAYLKLMVNPNDDTAFLRVVNTPRREIGPTTLEKLGNYARENRLSLFPACHHLGLGSCLPERAWHRLQQFANWLTLAADNAERGDMIKVIRGMLVDMDYFDWLENQSTSKEAAARAIANVDELIGWIERQHQSETEADPEFTDIVSQICLQDLLSHTKNDETEDKVHMMTLHAAKGLEFPHVYLVGAEEQILPHRNSIESDDIEEERRLAYVGMTRARHCLTFTRVLHRQRFGESLACEPSRFLEELPEDDVYEIGHKQTEESVERNIATGRETLDSLKALLSND